MNNYQEVRKLYFADLRNLCIRKNWFTRGNCAEYDRLLDIARLNDNITTDHIVTMARMIVEHTDFTDECNFESVCFELLRICNSFIEQIA